jgi:hypothetical protein
MSVAMKLLADIAADPKPLYNQGGHRPLNLHERSRMGDLLERGQIISADQRMDLLALWERDRAEDRKR